MPRKCLSLFCSFILVSAVTLRAADLKKPAQTRNAALRYWQAFSEMHEPPTDQASSDALNRMSSGDVFWDSSLSPILEQNTFAIEIMQRASRLPECDWGLDYDLGPRAPISYLPKARVLARLNMMYGLRAQANGETQKAIDTWLAGDQFAQHLARGGSLIFSLVAAKMLIADFHALQHAAQNSAAKLSDAQQQQIARSIQRLPETGFDWGEAIYYEHLPLTMVMMQLAVAKNPAEYFRDLMGWEAAKSDLTFTAADTAAFHRLMNEAEEVLRESPDAGASRLSVLQDQVQNLHPFYRGIIPSFVKINDARKEVLVARQELLRALNK
jgi:hypothetical protein